MDWQSIETMTSFVKSHSLDIGLDITNVLGLEMLNRFRIMSEFRTRSVFASTGRLVIEYYSQAQLHQIVRRVRGTEEGQDASVGEAEAAATDFRI